MIPTTIEKDIDRKFTIEGYHRDLNQVLKIHNVQSGANIYMPFESLVSKYKDFIEKYVDEEELSEDEINRYRYAPKQFSLDMYGTTGFWSVILFLNNCHSIIDFHPETIRFIEKGKIDEIIEEILALEE